jgi:hypothetical protein
MKAISDEGTTIKGFWAFYINHALPFPIISFIDKMFPEAQT